MALGMALGLSNPTTLLLSIVLAFVFGYALTVRAVVRVELTLTAALPVACASDTIPIAVMELVDTLVLVVIPGVMDACLGDALLWASLACSLAVAFVVTVPVNRTQIQRGKGHAVVHDAHG